MAEALAPTEPRERPILFKGRLVRAILDGTKSQTRRLVKWKLREEGLNLAFSGLDVGFYHSGLPASGWVLRSRGAGGVWNDRTYPLHCPFGIPGDRLWVRETWSTGVACKCASCRSFADEPGGVKYQASWCGGSYVDRWHPSIHMPRKFSRITLEVIGVRVERLHAITEADALAEGISRHGGYFDGAPHKVKGTPRCMPTARAAFADLWAHINGAEAWEANPWVWVIDFRRHQS